MARNSRGFLSGNTKKLRRRKKPTISDILESFSVGDRVIVSVKSERAGAPHLRYQGRMGTIVEKRKKGYVVNVKDGRKSKKVVSTAFHLKSVSKK